MYEQIKKLLNCPNGCQRCREVLDYLNESCLKALGMKFSEAPCLLEAFHELNRELYILQTIKLEGEILLDKVRRILRGES